ncbi:CIA30 family protein [Undibacterium sp. LX15W]|uniref:CIA30 family protein n=2 Tax=Undibacterium flavidum TaxID=2762297 RepID=A0ABR6Y948_9BURK|nr:CIA30 family protein [Undibacterium flavidum]
MRTALFTTGLLLLSAVQAQTQTQAQTQAATLIQNVRVFDGEKMLTTRHVLINQGKIVNANFKGKITSDMQLVDGTGRSLLPGLIDAHVHAFQDQDLPLLFGVTTQIDMFSPVAAMQDMHQRRQKPNNPNNANSANGSDVFSAGILATAPKGHGTEYGMEIETLTKPEQAQAWVDRRIAEGSHFIKIVMEQGGIGFHFNSLDLATVQALIKASHARHKLAVVHISTYADAKAALAAGADGLVHLFNGTAITPAQIQELVQLAKTHHAFVIPTFSVLESIAGIKAKDVLADNNMLQLLGKNQLMPLNTTYGMEVKQELLNAPKQLTAALHQAKIAVLAGTDAGNRGTQYGISLHHELAALVQAGMSPSAALQAATSAPARAFQLKDRGRVQNGYKADLLLVDGDPSADISSTRRIVEIWKNGNIVSPLRTQKIQQVAEENSRKKSAIDLPADGRISLFSASKFASPFGYGWMASTDAPMGGKSAVELSAADADIAGQTSLMIKATINPGFAFPWAGVVFFPSSQPMQPADLSNANTLKFKVKGDGKSYNVGFTMQGSYIPLNQRFTAGAEWQEISLSFKQFKGLDASIVTMLSFNAGPDAGTYQLQIADVRLLKE